MLFYNSPGSHTSPLPRQPVRCACLPVNAQCDQRAGRWFPQDPTIGRWDLVPQTSHWKKKTYLGLDLNVSKNRICFTYCSKARSTARFYLGIVFQNDSECLATPFGPSEVFLRISNIDDIADMQGTLPPQPTNFSQLLLPRGPPKEGTTDLQWKLGVVPPSFCNRRGQGHVPGGSFLHELFQIPTTSRGKVDHALGRLILGSNVAPKLGAVTNSI